MKKNLRIVSAAAAALLAVAPVAATVVVSAPTSTVKAAQDQTQYVITNSTSLYNRDGSPVSTSPVAADSPVVTTLGKETTIKISGTDTRVKPVTVKGNTYYVVESGLDKLAKFNGNVTETNNTLYGDASGISVPKPNQDQLVTNYVSNLDTTNIKKSDFGKITLTSADGNVTVTEGEPQFSQIKVQSNNGNDKTASDAKMASTDVVVIPVKYTVPANEAVQLNGKTYVAGDTFTVLYRVAVNGSTTPSKPNNGNQNNNGNQTTNPSKPSSSSSASVNAGNGTSIFDNTAVNTTIALNAVAKKDGIRGSLNGNIAVTLNGKSYTALLVNDANGQNTTVYEKDSKGNWSAVKPADMVANRKYFAEFHDVRVNLGNDYANKDVTINLPVASWFGAHDAAANAQKRTKNVHVDENGVAKLDTITSRFYAYDATDARGINFFDINTGDVVKSGTVNLHAVNGQLNVESIYRAINAQYRAEQVIDNNLDKNVSLLDDIKAQLVKQNIPVDPNGYFKAQTPINLTVTAKSNTNGATATLPVTVNVDNVTATAAQETTKTVTIMHISTIYDKNGKATHEPALRAYDTYSVVSTPVNLKDEKGNDAGKFYKLAGKDQYIKVGNVDGTSRSLKHNSYVYKSTGKRANKKTLKKGSSVTTYGKSFMIAGHQMYRIGKNQYVKKANF